MGIRSVYLAVSQQQLDDLWKLNDERFRVEVTSLDEQDLPRLQIDKLWDVLHFALTGKPAKDPLEGNPLSEAVVGVYPRSYDDGDYSTFASVIENDALEAIARCLQRVTPQQLENQLNPEHMERAELYPRGIWEDPTQQLVAELRLCITDIVAFFESVRPTENHVLVTIF